MIKSKKRLDMFLYLLLRECAIPCGEIETLVQKAENIDDEVLFSNKYLAGYAQNIRTRLDNNSVE
jgi:hypothetical protein